MYGKCDYLDLKGVVENVVESLGLTKVKYVRESENSSYHPGKTASLIVSKEKAGVFGEVHPVVSDNYGVDVNCYLAEIDLEVLFKNANTNKAYKPLPKFPAVTRDIALLVNDEVLVQEIENAITQAGGNLGNGLYALFVLAFLNKTSKSISAK